MNQENRQSPIFSLLLKLNKFANIQTFVEDISKIMEKMTQK